MGLVAVTLEWTDQHMQGSMAVADKAKGVLDKRLICGPRCSTFVFRPVKLPDSGRRSQLGDMIVDFTYTLVCNREAAEHNMGRALAAGVSEEG
jgi:hypothetical protein